ncbi:hypothetical protein BDW42DRAFT_189137 [Aspergillus taichungensis]|uniref:Secreted protein n=1 Tax=Aspergillus taichungensis TaxID=482145 RepID=A0A2J5HFF5_9EURO|nr:hypothetical protein BDW42DRAFT_189137 [Aspergillus taichungensis]
MIRAVIWCAAFFAAQAASQAASKCGTEEQCNKSCQDAWGEGYLSEKYDANAKVCKRCVNFKCMSRKETPYRDPLTGTMEGCPADTRFEFSEEVKKGECCENNKFLSVNATFNAVGCCPKGEPQHALFVNPCSGESSYCEATAIGFWDGVYHMPVPKPGPKVGPNPDPKPNPKDPVTGFPLALNGDCYISESEQSPLWQFRVTVKADGEIVLQDEIGPLNNKDEGPWFVCNGAHYRPCKDEKGVKCVTAKKWCTSDGCGTCLEADPQGIGRVCPGHNALGDTNNPRQCIPFQVEEVSLMSFDESEDEWQYDHEL